MLKRLLCYSQYLLPKHCLSQLAGKLANSRRTWIKNRFIDLFCRHYSINFSEAVIKNPHEFATFNDFFTRALEPGARPIKVDSDKVLSPADGAIAQFGTINGQQLVQAKGMYFNLKTLLASETNAALFEGGYFATVYLAPHNYHRVHMPMTGQLREATFIPGKLFSVNRMTSMLIPNLYARNERLVTIFDTEIGPIAVIMIGALIVGSIQTVWMQQPFRGNQIENITPKQAIELKQGDELGRFLLGSSVIVLLPKRELAWNSGLKPSDDLKLGQILASLGLH